MQVDLLYDGRKTVVVVVHTHTRITALLRDYPGESVPER